MKKTISLSIISLLMSGQVYAKEPIGQQFFILAGLAQIAKIKPLTLKNTPQKTTQESPKEIKPSFGESTKAEIPKVK